MTTLKSSVCLLQTTEVSCLYTIFRLSGCVRQIDTIRTHCSFFFIAHTTGLQSGSEKPLLDTKYVVIVAVCLSVVILVAVGIIAWCICVRVRHHKRTAKFPTLPPEDRRRYVHVHCTSQRLVTENRKLVTSQTAFPKNTVHSCGFLWGMCICNNVRSL